MSKWIKIADALPEDRGKAYQVMAAQVKIYTAGNYKGHHKRIFVQDWNVRLYPKNFVAWQYDTIGYFNNEEN